MENIQVDFGEIYGRIKPMHAVNNGPIRARGDQVRGNFEQYKLAGIPWARNHDAAFSGEYGGPHTVDVHMIFPDFNADPEDPESYDFANTDHCLKGIVDAGTGVFYRLGAAIEHTVNKYGTKVPKDFAKWAVVCEHIIRHYNEGWADGFHYDIEYWEIWNEPDLDPDDSTNKRCWGGTAEQFYEFYITAATHLKKCFPNLKIGGPALAHNTGEWTDGFLERLTAGEKRVPLDFFSWHWYGTEPEDMMKRARLLREKLDKAGYTQTESILNEWNYVAGWAAEWIDSIKTMISHKGAAFIAACMCAGQNEDVVDMLMYYDARPCVMNGLFDFYTLSPLKGYYAIKNYGILYRLGEQVCSKTENGSGDIRVVAAKNHSGDAGLLAAYYSDDTLAAEKTVEFQLNQLEADSVEIFVTDQNREECKISADVSESGTWKLTLQPNSVLFIRGKIKTV